ncbi:MAG: BCD family MFS transporter [Thermoflexales bacterium]|nr:BCD family MFS transporter [Thermoflexales bacterium]
MDPSDAHPTSSFSVARSLKLGSFHIGSAFADILGSSLWNYTLANALTPLGAFSATPIALLLALRQLIAPLTMWAGHLSDTRPVLGYRRLPYIWIGRALMLLSLPLLPVATVQIVEGQALVGWGLALLASLAYGVGTQVSGSPFVALVRESAPANRQGQAYAIVQTVLVGAFAFSPLVYARLAAVLLPSLRLSESALRQSTLDVFIAATGIGMTVAAVTWIFSVLGEERREAPRVAAAAKMPSQSPFLPALREALSDPRARAFFGLLALGAMSGFAQDGIFEPSLRQVFELSFSAAATVTGVWGTGLLLGMVCAITATRRWPAARQTRVTALGLSLAAFGLLMLATATATVQIGLLYPGVIVFGMGFGIYTAGGSPLLMVMTREGRAGLYVGVWSLAQLLFRGIGIALGGVLYDVFARLLNSQPAGYALVYALEALGFLGALILLRAARIGSWPSLQPAPSA